jgi:hypothetical protein
MKIKDIYDVLLPMKADMAAMKTDLKEHMRRTAMAEADIQNLKRGQWMFLGGITLLTIAATVATILRILPN